MEWMHTFCVLRNVSLTVIMFLGNNATGFLAVPSSQGFVTVSGHWRSVDNGLMPKLHTLLYVLYWYFLWQINTVLQIKCNFLFLMCFVSLFGVFFFFDLENEISALELWRALCRVGSTTNCSMILSFWETQIERFNLRNHFLREVRMECSGADSEKVVIVWGFIKRTMGLESVTGGSEIFLHSNCCGVSV